MFNKTLQALNTLQKLADQWPNKDDLLHNKNGLPVAVSTSTPIDVLPFGLERVYSEHNIKTRDAAAKELGKVCVIWGNVLDEPVPRNLVYVRAVEWLLKHHARAYERLSENLYRKTSRIICGVAVDAEQQCAFGAEYARYGCPGCVDGRLFRPYTGDGLLDSFVCDGCGETWSRSQMEAYMMAASRVKGVTPHVEVRVVEAARVLGESKETISNRVRRRGLVPVSRRGKTKFFWLDELV